MKVLVGVNSKRTAARHERGVRSVLVTIGLALALVSGPATQVGYATDSGSTKTARVKAAGIEFEYPENWVVLVLTQRDVKAQRKKLVKENPKLAKAYLEQAQLESARNTVFSAADLEAKLAGNPAQAVSVVLTSGSPSTLDQFRQVAGSELEGIGATVLDSSTVSLGGQDAYRMTVRWPVKAPDGTAVVLRLGVLQVPHGARGALVTVGVHDDEAGALMVDDVLGSVRLT